MEPAPSPSGQLPDLPSGSLPSSGGPCIEGGIGSRVSVDAGGAPPQSALFPKRQKPLHGVGP